MKAFVACVVLALCVMKSQQATTCAATSYCMGCSSTASTGCTSCFNWGSGKVGARAISTATPYTCTAALTVKTTDCKAYTGMASTTTTSGTCALCNGKTWRNESVSTANVSTHTCSNTAINTTTCATALSNCEQMVCRDYASTASTDYSVCAFCKKGYWGTAGANGYTACSNSGTNPITNCEYFTASSSTQYCQYCKSNYAVASTSTSCIAYTTDSNCRQLQSDGTNCATCWSAYYWNATVCKLSAKVVSAVMMIALSVISFIMY